MIKRLELGQMILSVVSVLLKAYNLEESLNNKGADSNNV